MDRKQSRLRRATIRRQNDGIAEQFSGPEVKGNEQQSWRRIRRAAAGRTLNRPGR